MRIFVFYSLLLLSFLSTNLHAQPPQIAVNQAEIKAFYYQRVSMPLEERYTGIWARPAGHPNDKVLIHPSAATEQRPAGTMISSPGGWYDAGEK